MNYTKIYASIVLRAQAERTERLALKKQGKYFEDHHIIPRSLNGADDISNMALLTGREHFICHWLLVKIYPVGSVGRAKMILALWRMQSHNNCHGERYINSRTYEYLRNEFAKYIGEITSVTQSGSRNSQHGTKWYTSMYTGESRKFIDLPTSNEWVAGRNVFNGQSSSIKQRLKRYNSLKKKQEIERRKQARKSIGLNSFQQELHGNAIQYAHMIWDNYHKGNYEKLEDYANELGISKMTLSKRFSKYIPIYSKHNQKKLKHCRSNKDLIGKYE